ncbi:DoxX family protein [Deinococcus proteolyticus MRP]|uniref:DoxX family protein n=1 Tax=Deinococcus proteolyticus (strain ATCC 35074 / DSM 20540 / JCM 6276 / NBRC 101906 / NCIMB 13154 / VKM Ac-1939 / CCM 2703 / MRP) TaxID=693977 RepID=F0RN21_DEIPM|nr:DoxX family protein [Deinococcus proteolyticus]ADY26163.1 DoxX family protein [Deinococcus proteolyticus MRP]
MNAAASRRTDTALLLLRLLLGTLLTLRGYQHLFVVGIEGTAAEWRGLGLPFPLLFAPLLSLLELVGGPLLILGLAVRPVATMSTLAVLSVLALTQGDVMLGLGLGRELLDRVLNPIIQNWLLLVAGTLTLALAGAGRFSIDAQRLPPRPAGPAAAAHPLDAVAETKPARKRK